MVADVEPVLGKWPEGSSTAARQAQRGVDLTEPR